LDNLTRDQGIINAKKFWGLMQLYSNYNYLFTMDSESLFLKEADLMMVCKEFYYRKILWSMPLIPRFKKIVRACVVHFDDDEVGKSLLNEYESVGLFLLQPFIYSSEHLNDFFIKTRMRDRLDKLTFWDFDHVIYMLYLLAYQDFQCQDFHKNSDILQLKTKYFTYLIESKLSDTVATQYPAAFMSMNIDRDALQRKKWEEDWKNDPHNYDDE